MRLGGKPFPSVMACGLAAAALFAWAATARAQAGNASAAGPAMMSGSPGVGGPGMTGSPALPGGNNFAGGGSGTFPGGGSPFGGSGGATFGASGGAGTLGGTAPSGGGGSAAPSGTGGSGAIVALTYYATPVNPPSPSRTIPARLSPELQDLISRSDSISAETRRGLTVAYGAGETLVLRGTVVSAAESHALESLIRFAPGVTAVRNELTLAGPGRSRARD